MPRVSPVGSRAALILGSFAVWACNGSPGPAVSGAPEPEIDTIAGVVHLRNPARGAWSAAETWTVEELLRIGARESPAEELFSGPLLTATEGPNGMLYVLDSDAEQISVFSAQGAFIRRIGRSGRGPGEFVAPSGLVWDGYGRLWVADGFGGRYSVFSANGHLIRTQKRPVAALARRQAPLIYLQSGSFIDEASQYPSIRFLRVDTAGASVDTLGMLSQPEISVAGRALRVRPGSAFEKVSRLFVNRRRWALAPDGSVWIADTGELRLVHCDLAGDTIRIVHTQHRSFELTSSQNDVIDDGLAEVGLERGDIEIVRPVLQQILVMGDGHVLVQIETEVDRDGRVFDVFDPDGRFLGSVDYGFAPTPLAGTTFRGDTMLAVTLGDLDVPYVVKAVLRRAGEAPSAH